MDAREQLRVQESLQMQVARQVFDERLEKADAAASEAEAKSAPPDEVETLRLAADNVRREQELFYWEHDTTGAWKGDRFGNDLRTQFEAMGFERRKDGTAGFREGGEKTHVILVNMAELDRLNDSGDHALGDKALELAYARIQEVVSETLVKSDPTSAHEPRRLADYFELYRTAGNDFSLILKNVSESDAEDIRRRVSGMPLDVSGARAGEEPVTLTADRLSFNDIAKVMERLRKPEENGMDSEATLFITALREKVQTISDFNKIRTRLDRMIGKIKTPGESRLTPQTLYDKYLKKSLGTLFAEPGAEPLDFASFTKALEQRGAFDGEGSSWRRARHEAARSEAVKQFVSRNIELTENSRHILESAIAHLETTSGLQTSPEDFEAASGKRAGFAEMGADEEAALAAFDQRTAFLGRTTGEERLAALEARAAQAFEGPRGEEERRRVMLELSLEQAKRDRLTGLAGRGVFFQTLEARLAGNEPVSVVAIDMAFLKYFDKEGGGKTGDAAIKTAGRILDFVAREAAQAHGIAVEACRTGGDEFSLSVGSADRAVLGDIVRRLREAQLKAGEIPSLAGARTTYRPESLQFNIGMFGAGSLGELAKKFSEMGLTVPEDINSPESRRTLADETAHVADAEVEGGKIVSRFAFLLVRTIGVQRAKEEERAGLQMNLETLLAYSEKAIFGAAGKRKLSQWIPRLLKREIQVRELLDKEIIPFVREELKKKGKESLEVAEEFRRDMEVDIRYTLSELRVAELEQELEETSKRLGEEHDNVKRLQVELKSVRAEREEIVSLKTKIAKAA